MSVGILVVLVAGALIGWFNGANDVSKGIATLVGSGVTDYKKAIGWGTFCTALGGLAAAVFAGAMVTAFGKGLLGPGVTPTLAAALATILGAAVWVIVATRTGLPVSTTHAIVGSIAGVSLVAYGLHGFAWAALGKKVALPLLLSPLVSGLATVAILKAVRLFVRKESPATSAACLCAEVTSTGLVALGGAAGMTAAVPAQIPMVCPVHVELTVGSVEECADKPAATTMKVGLDGLHWLTSGATSFARGMNDAPKMAALILAAGALTGHAIGWLPVFVLVTAGMVAGSLAGGRRITKVLAENVTKMDHEEGFVANLVTSVLVASGAFLGWPMSTTHVSSSAIVGAGTLKGKGGVSWKTVNGMALAWVVTLPIAALLGAICYAIVAPVVS